MSRNVLLLVLIHGSFALTPVLTNQIISSTKLHS